MIYGPGEFKGGMIKASPIEEEWSFNQGKVSLCSSTQNYGFYWDGSTLKPDSKTDVSIGYGQWDGCLISWYLPTDHRKPVVEYIYAAYSKEYENVKETSSIPYAWKWTRHFLAKQDSSFTWQIEGDVPEPVVMFIQIFRSHIVPFS